LESIPREYKYRTSLKVRSSKGYLLSDDDWAVWRNLEEQQVFLECGFRFFRKKKDAENYKKNMIKLRPGRKYIVRKIKYKEGLGEQWELSVRGRISLAKEFKVMKGKLYWNGL
jgi:hypothetical protein